MPWDDQQPLRMHVGQWQEVRGSGFRKFCILCYKFREPAPYTTLLPGPPGEETDMNPLVHPDLGVKCGQKTAELSQKVWQASLSGKGETASKQHVRGRNKRHEENAEKGNNHLGHPESGTFLHHEE